MLCLLVLANLVKIRPIESLQAGGGGLEGGHVTSARG
jgi:hypothetical protein